MNAAMANRNVIEDFVLDQDILYYRTGHHGLVSFHGTNFNVRRQLTDEQLQNILSEATFYKANTDCYVNLMKIRTIRDSRVYFDSTISDAAKCVPVSRAKQHRLKDILDRQFVTG